MSILVPDLVSVLLAGGAAVAIGVSGGKDSCAVAFAMLDYLDSIGHTGPRLLVHSDLGEIEWCDSLPTCERLAAATGLELLVLRRRAGGMIPRWRQRWTNNKARYRDLSCVKLILPWSTPAMRFCTSELKVGVISSALKKRFPGRAILSVSGIRRDESAKRAKAEPVKPQPKLGPEGYDWHPILDWTRDDVFGSLAERGFRLHEAYRVYGSGRVSCSFCIMSSAADLRASADCPDNAAAYREVVALEIESAYHFQSGTWLGDVAPELLGAATLEALGCAKERAKRRDEIEARIPKHLLYTKGWPHRVPTPEEAELIAGVRREVAALYGWRVACTTAEDVIARHVELLALKASKEAEKARRSRRRRKGGEDLEEEKEGQEEVSHDGARPEAAPVSADTERRAA